MNWYKLSQFVSLSADQLDLFGQDRQEEQEEQEPEVPEREVPGEERAERRPADIRYMKGFTQDGAHFVMFKINDKYYSYQLSFKDWIEKVRKIATRSGKRARNWADRQGGSVFEVTENYPARGSILRQVR